MLLFKKNLSKIATKLLKKNLKQFMARYLTIYFIKLYKAESSKAVLQSFYKKNDLLDSYIRNSLERFWIILKACFEAFKQIKSLKII